MIRYLLLALLALLALSEPSKSQPMPIGLFFSCGTATVATPLHSQSASSGTIFGPVTGSNSTTISFPAAVASGHAVMGIATFGSSNQLRTITDDKGNSYSIDDSITDVPNDQTTVSFHLINITNSPITLTFTFLNTGYYNAAMMAEDYANVGALDKHTIQLQVSPGTTADAVSSGSVTTAFNGELIFGATSPPSAAGTLSAGTGFTLQDSRDLTGGLIPLGTESLVQGAAGAVAATFTSNIATGTFATAVLTFQAPSAQTSCAPAAPTNTFIVAKNGNDTWSGLLPAPNGSATDGPFASLTKCQSAMRASGSTKSCSVRSGTYTLTASLDFTTQDNGETWQYYPPDGFNTATIDGGSSSSTTGVDVFTTNCCNGNAGATSNPTGLHFNGLKLQNGNTHLVAMNVNNTIFENMDIGFNHNPGAGFNGQCISFNGTNNTFRTSYVHDCTSQGIAMYAFNASETINGSVIDRNVVLRTVQNVNDGGAIYTDMRSSVPAGVVSNVTISNNFVRDQGNSGVQAEGIYLDDDSSHVTITGNIVGPPSLNLNTGVINMVQLNGGFANIYSNNIIDTGRSNIGVNAEGPCGTGGTVDNGNVVGNCGRTAPNQITGNIILSKFAGGSTITNFDCNSCEYDQNPASSSLWLTISNNTYHNYGGGVEITNGNIISDSSPIHADPLCTGYLYNLGNLPAGFADVAAARSAGPPGFVIPTSTNRSCP